MYTFTPHTILAVDKAKRSLNAIKSLAGTSWGQEKETLVTTYKTTCRSILDYGGSVCHPQVSATNWEKMERVERQALRVATGCVRMTDKNHLHAETKVIPIQKYSAMLTNNL